MTDYEYPYATGDLLEKRNTYTYTPFLGTDFIDGWLAARKSVLRNLPEPASGPRQSNRAHRVRMPDEGRISTEGLLDYLLSAYQAESRSEDAEKWLAWIVQRFEVSKRLYLHYYSAGKAVRESGYRCLELYLTFGEVLDAAYRADEKLNLLNVFLKTIDTLCAFHQELSSDQKSRLSRLISCELNFICALTAEKKVLV